MKKILAILIVLLITEVSLAKHTITYSINNTYYDVVAAVERLANEPRTTPFKVPNLPALIEGKDVVVNLHIRPAKRYYSTTIELENSIGKMWKFNKKLEVWGKSDKYIIRSSVDIGWGRDLKCGLLNRIKQSILDKAECAVLQLEKQKIMKYAARIETVEVEQEKSWGWIMGQAWEVVTAVLVKLRE